MAANPVTPVSMSDAERAIRALAKDYQEHYNRRDGQKVASLFTSDGITNPPFHQAVQGQANIAKDQERQFQEQDPKNLKIETTRVEYNGDIGFSYGTYSMNARLPNQTRIDDHGKWITGFRREGGQWRIVTNCWNSDLNLMT